jgi:hypothetical protein
MKNFAHIPGDTVKVYGESDDRIVVEGIAEFDAWDMEPFLFFGDGTVLRCWYDSHTGGWRIDLHRIGDATVSYSNDWDTVVLTGNLVSVECWPADEPEEHDFLDVLCDVDWMDYDVDTLRKVYDILAGAS